MMTLIKNISSLVTIDAGGKTHLTGKDMQNIGEIKNGAILFDEVIKWVGTTEEAEKLIAQGTHKADKEIDAKGKTVIPGFVDSHTHIVFGGSRSNEFARRLRGTTYQELAAEGGGILTTMKATRTASIDELYEVGAKLAKSAMKYGTTAMEIKSGYGLTLESELNQLRAIKKLQETLPLTIKSTFMGAHDFPPEYKNDHEKYIDLIINEMIPAVAAEGLADYCDAFVDKGYYTLDQAKRLFTAAKNAGMQIRCHCDELADVSAAKMAAEIGAISADHLLFISDESIEAMHKSSTIATLLPGTAYFIRMPYAPARKIIESGCTVALATDANPGSCFTENMQMILSLAVINMKMTAEEALVAATLNGAKALGLSNEMGSLEIEKKANFCIYDCTSYTDIFYHFAINQIESTWINGAIVFQ
jgi:imidazolonepropionase